MTHKGITDPTLRHTFALELLAIRGLAHRIGYGEYVLGLRVGYEKALLVAQFFKIQNEQTMGE